MGVVKWVARIKLRPPRITSKALSFGDREGRIRTGGPLLPRQGNEVETINRELFMWVHVQALHCWFFASHAQVTFFCPTAKPHQEVIMID